MRAQANHPTIAVYGATGFTGRLVCDELARRGAAFLIAGRNAQGLENVAEHLRGAHDTHVSARVASVDNATSLDDMLHGVDVLINCAGPFVDLGPPVAWAALRNDVHYLDTTGEQAHMCWLREHCGEFAAKRELAVVPACAVEYAAGDFAAEFALRKGARNIAVCYAVDHIRSSAGTRKSVMRALESRGFTFVDGWLEQRPPAYTSFDVPFPDGQTRTGYWIPGGEPLTVPARSNDVERVESCMVVPETVGRILTAAGPWISRLLRGTRPALDRVIDLTTRSPAPDRAPFTVVAFHPGTGELYATLMGLGPYMTTACVICEAACRLLAGAPRRVGFTSPAALFEPEDFLAAVNIEWQI